MTAINLALTPSDIHIFTDGGHFVGEHLRYLGSKVHRLSHLDAALTVSGPSSMARSILERVEQAGFLDLSEAMRAFPAICKQHGSDCFSAVLVGFDNGLPVGIAVEEGGRVHTLVPGSVIKSMPSEYSFSADDLPGSGLTMVLDQRQRHGLVAGFCEHTVLKPQSMLSNILHRWDDIPAQCRASKIGKLAVERIKINNSAVSGTGEFQGTGIVPNPASHAIALTGAVTAVVNGNFITDPSISWTMTRSRDGKIMTEGSASLPDGTYNNVTLYSSASTLDLTATTSETYSISTFKSGTPGTITITSEKIFALYRKDP